MDARKARPCGRGVRWAAWALAAALCALSATALAAGRVALVIGNSKYHDPDAVLGNPGNDADGMAAALGRLGFEVVLGKDLDRDGFFDTLGKFAAAARGADVALLFYAGHGLQVDGRNWLVPVDASLESKWDLERRAVKLDTVMDAMQGRANLVLLDACRNNPLARGLARAMGVSRAAEAATRGLARVEKGRGRFIGYATAPDDVAADGTGRNSPFTEALLAHIENPKWSVPEMFGKVAESVVDATGGAQEPWQTSSLRGDPLHLASAAVAPPPKVTPTPTTGGTPAPSGDAARAYEAAERLNTVAAYRIVVEGFPGSIYARLAQAWMDKHEQAPLVVAGGDDTDETAPPPKSSHEEVEDGLGLSNEAKRLVQMGLAAAGHSPGSADGLFGGKTRRALRAWQASKEVEATGYLTKEQGEVLAALGREEAQRLRVAAEAERERKAKEAEEAARRARAEAERKRKAKEAEAAARRARAEAERRRKAKEAEERRLAEARRKKPGDTFRDCPECPEMVVVPSGRFRMGSPESEEGRRDDGREGPVHPVTIGRPFAVGVYEVTRGEFARFASATGRSTGNSCWVYDGEVWKERSGRHWKSPGFRQTDDHPVVCVNWNDAQAYVRWLSGRTGKKYRLLSEAEWEYVARAGTRTARYWGEGESGQCVYANGADRTAKRHNSGWTVADCDDGHYQTAPVGSFHANGYKLHDVLGNVWEWTEDCWNDSYQGAPRDGSAWTSGECGRRVLRGGSWSDVPGFLRSANRSRDTAGFRFNYDGFRVARTLTP